MTLSGYSESHCQPGSVMPSGEVLGLPGQATSRLGLRLVERIKALAVQKEEPFLARFGPGGSKAFPLQADHDGTRSFFFILD